MSRDISQKLGILRKSKKIYEDNSILCKCFFSFTLPHFQYCSAVWSSAADCHIRLLDRGFNSVKGLLSELDLDIGHHRNVGALCMLYKIVNDVDHPLYKFLPNFFRPARVTRYSESANSLAFKIGRVSTSQFSRSFLPSTCRLWNTLPTDIVTAPTLDKFKRLANGFLLRNR